VTPDELGRELVDLAHNAEALAKQLRAALETREVLAATVTKSRDIYARVDVLWKKTHSTKRDWRRKAWRIDQEGIVHWPGLTDGKTYCRRPSVTMSKSWDGTLQVSCEACRDLYKLSKVDPWTGEQGD
jgi:nucleoside-diphosphate-sugar epimerase